MNDVVLFLWVVAATVGLTVPLSPTAKRILDVVLWVLVVVLFLDLFIGLPAISVDD